MLLHNIRKKCVESGLTLRKLESAAGLSENSIFRWNDLMPAADKLARVAAVLGTSSEALLRGEGDANEAIDCQPNDDPLRAQP